MRIAFVLLLALLAPPESWGDVASARPLDLTELKLPSDFQISIYARGLGSARLLAFSPNGTLFVSDLGGGRILAIPSAGRVVTFATGLNLPHGLAFRGGDLYVAENQRIIVFRNAGNSSLQAGPPEMVVGLPADKQDHLTRTILWTPDGKLMATAGSTCNLCDETDPRFATAMRFNADGSGMEIFARGLRNAVGIAVHPVTGDVWATDNGGDGLGDDVPPDEIDILKAGGDYGWPHCYGNGQRYPGFAGSCSSITPPELSLQAHSAPLGIGFYTGDMFPAAYRNDAFVAFHGSWNRTAPTGYKVVRVIASSGHATGIEDFLTGFLRGNTTSGRPVHAITGPDGALYVSDDMNGIVYRISYSSPPAVALPSVTAVTNAASLLPAASVAPGQMISIFGAGIGPAAAASLQINAGIVNGTLGGVRVLFDGIAAPMIYASATLVSAIVPYAVAGKRTTRLQVEYQGATSSGFDLPVADSAPGIFTMAASGRGQGAILNQDYSVNSTANPAGRGSFVMIYATGEGQTDPVGVDGLLTGATLRKPLQPVSVTIGGQQADVFYSGSAPGLIAGILQVNARVPAGVASGDAVPVLLTIGTSSSPSGVTMAVQ